MTGILHPQSPNDLERQQLPGKARLCIKSLPAPHAPFPRPGSSFLIALQFVIGSESLAEGPISNSQARYQSGKPRVISTMSPTLMEWKVVSYKAPGHHSKPVSDGDD